MSIVKFSTTKKENLAKNFENLRIGIAERVGPIEIYALHSTKVSSTHQAAHTSPSVGHATEFTVPRVNQINIDNRSDAPLFLPEGWIIEGLQQSRALCEDILVPANATTRANVVCIEAGRWGNPRQSSMDNRRAPISVITAMRSVENLDTFEGLRLRQDRVWASVKRQESRSGKRSTSSLAQILEEDSQLNEIAGHFSQLSELGRRPRGQSGVMVALSGEPLFAEIFQSPELFTQNYISLIKSVPFDVVDANRDQTSKSAVDHFLSEVLNTPRTTERSYGPLRTFAGISVRAIDVRSSQTHDQEKDFLHLLGINQSHRALQLI